MLRRGGDLQVAAEDGGLSDTDLTGHDNDAFSSFTPYKIEPNASRWLGLKNKESASGVVRKGSLMRP